MRKTPDSLTLLKREIIPPSRKEGNATPISSHAVIRQKQRMQNRPGARRPESLRDPSLAALQLLVVRGMMPHDVSRSLKRKAILGTSTMFQRSPSSLSS